MTHKSEENRKRSLQRELALVKVVAEGELQDAALNVVGAWSGRLLELTQGHFTAEISAEPDRISRFIADLTPFGLSASYRSGALTL